MENIPADTAARVVKLLICGMLAMLVVVAYVFYTDFEGRKNTVTAQRAGCERSKLDRTANAAFQRAHTEYITTVTGAKSVKEDVKKAARKAVKTFQRTSKDLSKRAKIKCRKAFPKASFFP